MRLRYVVSTMVFWWREHHLSFEQECDYLKSLGMGIELWPTIRGSNDCRFSRKNWTRLKSAAEGMFVSLNSRNDGPTIEEWQEQIDCAEMLKGPIVANLQSMCISDQLGIADWAFASDVIAYAKQKNVPICIETGGLHALLQVGEKFDYINYCLDTGYMNINTRSKFSEYVDKLAERTTYLHISDNYGELDDHEPAGLRGGIAESDWRYLLEGLGKYENDIIASLEMFPSMPGVMIRQATEFLFDIMGWPHKPDGDNSFTAYRPL